MIPPIPLKDFIKAEAQILGFDRIGFTYPDAPQSFPVYLHWLNNQHHAGMSYLARTDAVECRADPRRLFPQVKTILCLAIAYPRPEDAPSAGDQTAGRVAAYAWGQDYHHHIPELLQRLMKRVEQFLGKPVNSKIFTDSAPILERDLARRAGLGWIGKNSCLIHPRHGSYFLLAEAFLDVEIEPDAPFETDHCGTCRRCIEACPTGCILPDRTLDAGRCIAYLTIENKSIIPPELRDLTGDWVFGCDICQQVCPWNIRFASAKPLSNLAEQHTHARPILTEELGLTEQTFRSKFANHPIYRAKRRGYLRNIAVALGNSDAIQVIGSLNACLNNEADPLIRAHAAWALGKLGSARARAILAQASRTETEPTVLEEIRMALRILPDG